MGNNSHLAGLLTGPARTSHTGLARRPREGVNRSSRTASRPG